MSQTPTACGTWMLLWEPRRVYVPDESMGRGTVAMVPAIVWVQVWRMVR